MPGWKFVKREKPTIGECMEGFNQNSFNECIKKLPAGTEAHVLVISTKMFEKIRPHMTNEPDMEGMRKFFHGPLLEAFMEAHNNATGNQMGKDEAKEFLKAKFLGFVDDNAYKYWKELLNFGKLLDTPELWKAFREGTKYHLTVCHTSNLNGEQYKNFVLNCKGWLHQTYEIVLENPDEN